MDEVRAVVEVVRAVLDGLPKASAAQKAPIYVSMGLKLTYDPEADTLDIEDRPVACTQVRVGGGT